MAALRYGDISRMHLDPHAAQSLPYLEFNVGSPTQLRTPSFMAIGLGNLLPGVAENPTFSMLSALGNATGLGYYRRTCDLSLLANGVREIWRRKKDLNTF